jgi:hypothetical protein
VASSVRINSPKGGGREEWGDWQLWQAYLLGHLAKSIHGYYLVYRNFDNENENEPLVRQI